MSLNVSASQVYFKNLKCAYTGQPMSVKAISRGSAPAMFFSPDAFDPTFFRDTSQELFAMLGTRDGVRGAARNGGELVCPYTGNQMTINHAAGLGFQALGGFSPSTPVADPVAYARAVMSRKGKVSPKAPKAQPPPKVAARAPVEKGEPAPTTSIDLARETADRLVHMTAKPVTVSMAGAAKE